FGARVTPGAGPPRAGSPPLRVTPAPDRPPLAGDRAVAASPPTRRTACDGRAPGPASGRPTAPTPPPPGPARRPHPPAAQAPPEGADEQVRAGPRHLCQRRGRREPQLRAPVALRRRHACRVGVQRGLDYLRAGPRG